MEKTKVKSSIRNFLLALILLLVTHILMGVTLVAMSKKSLREQINQRMLDVANTAAYQLDGDILGALTAEDEGTEDYQKQLEILRAYQKNIELDYIYGIRAEGNDVFTFTIDPDEEDPGEFGSPVVTTDALKAAANGTPSVDSEAYTDEWGRFYSAYAPVFDSNRNVAGIVGVDFNADWYDSKLNSHRAAAVIITMVALTIGIALSFLMFSQNRKRFVVMLGNIDRLRHQTEKFDKMILESSKKKLDMIPESESALLKTLAAGEKVATHSVYEYDALNSSITDLYDKFKKYMRFIDTNIFIDDTTGVNNKGAYRSRISELDEKIKEGKAEFSLAFFDINGLKKIYTHNGFEAGEKILFECAKLLKTVFGRNSVYHITGDEFVIIAEEKNHWEMKGLFEKFEKLLEKYNEEHASENNISVAKGTATYDPEKHSNYRAVFVETKEACDRDKDVFYGRAVSYN